MDWWKCILWLSVYIFQCGTIFRFHCQFTLRQFVQSDRIGIRFIGLDCVCGLIVKLTVRTTKKPKHPHCISFTVSSVNGFWLVLDCVSSKSYQTTNEQNWMLSPITLFCQSVDFSVEWRYFELYEKPFMKRNSVGKNNFLCRNSLLSNNPYPKMYSMHLWLQKQRKVLALRRTRATRILWSKNLPTMSRLVERDLTFRRMPKPTATQTTLPFRGPRSGQ
jgi:hypothetical protein